MTSEAKLWALYKSWDALVKHKEKMGQTILELVAHPEATPQDIERVVPQYRDIVGKLRAHKPVILKALDKGGSWRVHNAYDNVKNTNL